MTGAVQFRFRDEKTLDEYYIGTQTNRQTNWKFEKGEEFFYFGEMNKVLDVALKGMRIYYEKDRIDEFEMMQIVYIEPVHTDKTPYEAYTLTKVNI